MAIDHVKRARRAWPILAKMANGHRAPCTYGGLCGRLSLHHRAAQWFLGEIQKECKRRKWPALQALVVNKKTRLPGSGYHGSVRTYAGHEKELNKVRGKRWPIKAPF